MMISLSNRRTWFRLFLVPLALCASLSSGAERVALVIGNDEYRHAAKLETAVNDAGAIAASLKQLRFEVIQISDAGLEKIYESLAELRSKAAGAQAVLIYFAGHGIESRGANYLLPIDAVLEREIQLKTQTISLRRVLDELDEIRVPARMVILDCCRNNPLEGRDWIAGRSTGIGLASLSEDSLTEATLVVFSASPGKKALDRVDPGDSHSPFAQALLDTLPEPGVHSFEVFGRVEESVIRWTDNRQKPRIFYNGSTLPFRKFRFAPEAVTAGEPTSSSPPKPKPKLEPSPPPEPPAPAPPNPVAENPKPEMPPEPKWSDRVAGLPSRGFFNNAEVYAGGPFAAYNDYSRKEILKQVQTKLKQEGLYASGIDGVMGPGTQRGLVEWQRKHGLAASGRLDPISVGQFGISGIREMEPPEPKVTARESTVAGTTGAAAETTTASAGSGTLQGKWKGRFKLTNDMGLPAPEKEQDAELTIDLNKKTIFWRPIKSIYPTSTYRITSVTPPGRKLTAKNNTGNHVTIELGSDGKTAIADTEWYFFGKLDDEGKATLTRAD